MMIIDLSVPRLFVKDKVDEIIFNAKMRGYKLERDQLTAVFAAAMLMGYNSNALFSQSSMEINEGLKQNIYAIIFALLETIKSCTYEDLRSMGMYFKR
jgi:hypothetical protein